MDDQTQTNPFPPDKLFVPPPGYNDLSGMTLGGYKLVRKIAQGGMGVIYEAVQINLARKVALKVLAEQLATRPEFLQRFEREAKAAASLNHPNIVQVHDFGEADGRCFIIMEFIDGENLSEYISKRGKIPVENALAIIEQAALALKAAAEKSIVHRDIKPSNLMVTRDGRVKVADMGLAKILTEDSELTMSSVSIGSPHFIAPEQAGSSKTADHRVDIYSLGVTLLYLVTGKYAYDGDSPISIVLAHATRPLPSGAELGTDLPPEIEALIRRMAAKNPDERYQNYDELLADLHLVKQGYLPMAAPLPPQAQPAPGPSGRKLAVAISIGAVLLLAVIGGLIYAVSKKQPAQIKTAAASPAPVQTQAAPGGPQSGDRPVPPAQPPGNDFQPPQGDDQPPDQQGMPGGGNGRPPYPMPMGPPPRPDLNAISDGPVETMLAAADDYAAKNPGEFMNVLARYRQVQQKAAGTSDERTVEGKIQQWNAAQNQAATATMKLYETKMRAVLASSGPQAAYDVWKDFPTGLRSRETDGQIVKLLEQVLPPDFRPAGRPPMMPQ
jgi:predicted Ser/Thr protein kinase/flagellar motor protein MotB